MGVGSWSLSLMRTDDAARATDEHSGIARVGAEHQRPKIGARAEGQLNIGGRVAGDRRVHQRDPGAVVGNKTGACRSDC